MEFNRYIKKYNTISFFEETEEDIWIINYLTQQNSNT
jgi:hypothetical protein